MRLPAIPTVSQRLPAHSAPAASDAAIGLGFVVLAALVRVALAQHLGTSFAFITFYPAVAFAAWLGGLVAGLSATAAAAVLTALLVDPTLGLAVENPVPNLIFVVSGIGMSVMGGRLRAGSRAAHAARERAAFLAEASRVLSASLDTPETARALARVAVPAFADWFVIDLLGEDGEFESAWIHHRDPAKVALGYRLRRERPVRTADPRGPGLVVRTGRSATMYEIPRDLARLIDDPPLASILADLDLRSYLCVPLMAPGRTIGALSVFRTGQAARFDEDDLALLEDLAARAAVALAHAGLFRAARARSEELDRVIEAMEDGVLVVDARGLVRSRNAAAARILGADPGASADDVLARLVPDPASPGVMRSPTHRYVRVARHDARTELGPAEVILLHDVTELLESQAARDAFVGMLSHELRTPVTTIFGAASILRRPLGEEARGELLADLTVEADRLYRLVEDLLVLSRHERSRLEFAPEPVLLQRVLPRLASLEAARTPETEIRVDVARRLPPVIGDATYVEQVVRNLVSNAVKYAGGSGPIEIRAREAGAFVEVEVVDHGPGVPESQRERIFSLYERLPDAPGRAPGAGVGLFVCRRLVELMGGRIEAGVAPGGGGLFRFTLPVHADEEAGSARPDPGMRDGHGDGAPAASAPR